MVTKQAPNVTKLNRLGHQLALTEKNLRTHPLTQEKWGIVRTALFYLNAQTRWSSAGSLTRLLIALQTAFTGYQTEKSEIGFIGPQLEKMQQAALSLMATTISRDTLGMRDLLETTLLMTTVGISYIATQVLGEWKGLFPANDPTAAKKGGRLLQELGLIWLLGSHTIEDFFDLVIKGLELEERNQKIVKEIGLFYVSLLVIVITDEEDELREELLETLEPFMIKTLSSVEKGLEKAVDQGLLTEDWTISASGYLQLMRRALDNRDVAALHEVIQSGFEAFDVPYEQLKGEAKQLVNVCAQMNKTFKNIFYQSEKTMTTMNQAA